MTEPKRASRKKEATPPPVKGYVIDSDDPVEVAKSLACCIPEWGELKQPQRDELVRHSLNSRLRPARAKVAAITDAETGNIAISPPEKHQASHAIRIYETFATASEDIVFARLSEIQSHFSKSGADTSTKMSAALAFIAGCNPENEQQSAMATQMALVHDAAMTALGAAKRAEYMDTYEKYSNQANKLSRTFAMLTDSYAKLQRGGVQTVKHVNVYEGGQAVVADTVHTGGMNAKRPEPAHAARDPGVGPSMLGHDPQWNGVPVASREGQEALPDARRREG